EKEYQRAIALNPNYAVAHHWYSSFLLRMGRRQFASRENASALRLDPLSATIVTSTGQLVRDEGRFEEARVYFQKAIELDPAYSGAHFDLAENFRLAGMCKDSVAALARAHEIVGHAEQAAAVRKGYAERGCRGAIEGDLGALRKRAEKEYVDPGDLAFDYLQLGDKEHAVEWLEKAYREKSQAAPYL